MIMGRIVDGLLSFPWAWLVQNLWNVFIALVVWQLTKHYYHREWLRFAPDKAKDMINELNRALAVSEIERQALEGELAVLRGKEARAQAILAAAPRREK